jgi:ABC-type Na+ efflux pump permease subunit
MYGSKEEGEIDDMFLFKIVGVLFALFVVLFIAITVEESFLGGRRRRRLEQKARDEGRDAK